MVTPIIHYELNASDIGRDSSGNGFDLTNTNVSLVTDPDRGEVASFDGSTSIMNSVSTLPESVSGSNPRTFMFWAKISSISYVFPFCHGVLSTRAICLGNFETSGFRVTVYNDRSNYTTVLPIDTWFHIAYTYDGTTLNAYLDGVPATPKNIVLNTAVSILNVGHGSIFNSNQKFNGLMSDFRIYDVALSESEINTSSITPVSYSPVFTTLPSSTAIETSWESAENATSYRLTVSGDLSQTLDTSLLQKIVYNLEPSTEYTVGLYYTVDGFAYTLLHETTVTTLSDTLENANLGLFLNGGVYDLRLQNDDTRTLLEGYLHSLDTGDNIYLNAPGLNHKKLTVVNHGSTWNISTSEAVILPSNATDGTPNDATLELSDNSIVSVRYDDSTNSIDVGESTYFDGDSFILDGKKVTIVHQ